MNIADKKVVLDAITEAAVCLAAIPDFMAGERITNALHQLKRAGDILEMGESIPHESFFKVGESYEIAGETLVFVKHDKGAYQFKPKTFFGVNSDGLIPFDDSIDINNFTKL